MKDVIKNALEKKKMSQKELAERIYVSQQAVSQWIKGEKRPSWDNIRLMTEIFGDEFAEKAIRKGTSKKQNMKKQDMDIKDLDTFDKAQAEATNILEYSGIQHYNRAIYSLLMWITTAVIGLVYHQYLHNKDPETEYYYEDIYYYLNDIIDEKSKDTEQAFYCMGGDLFESLGDDNMKNYDYAHDCMSLWYKFKKAYDGDDESDFNREFIVALLEIISKNSCY